MYHFQQITIGIKDPGESPERDHPSPVFPPKKGWDSLRAGVRYHRVLRRRNHERTGLCLSWPSPGRDFSPNSEEKRCRGDLDKGHPGKFRLVLLSRRSGGRTGLKKGLDSLTGFSRLEQFVLGIRILYHRVRKWHLGQEDMKKARFYAGLIHLLDFLGWYKIIKWGGVNRTILSRALFKPIS